jgi:acetyl-CoA carboxylase biotin carboxyl carrier protein
MDLAYLRKLIKILDQSNMTEMEIDEEGIKLRLAKSTNSKPGEPVGSVMPFYHMPAPLPQYMPSLQPETTSAGTPKKEERAAEPTVQYLEVKSPIVGTFYRAPAPDADPYVEVGQEVEPGTVLCIVEAMKLMNEIESDVKGKIVKIIAENAQAVEYNQTLFFIEPIK